MITRRRRPGNRINEGPKSPAVGKLPTRKFPVEREIQQLEEELQAFNERIAYLEDEGHESRATDVLKANALDFARRIDELRAMLAEINKQKRVAD